MDFLGNKEREKHSSSLTGRALSGIIPHMKLIADQKRRVVLPKPVQPGDALAVVEVGDRIILERLKRPERVVPPVSPHPLLKNVVKGIDLDEPAFPPMSDESPA